MCEIHSHLWRISCGWRWGLGNLMEEISSFSSSLAPLKKGSRGERRKGLCLGYGQSTQFLVCSGLSPGEETDDNHTRPSPRCHPAACQWTACWKSHNHFKQVNLSVMYLLLRKIDFLSYFMPSELFNSQLSCGRPRVASSHFLSGVDRTKTVPLPSPGHPACWPPRSVPWEVSPLAYLELRGVSIFRNREAPSQGCWSFSIFFSEFMVPKSRVQHTALFSNGHGPERGARQWGVYAPLKSRPQRGYARRTTSDRPAFWASVSLMPLECIAVIKIHPEQRVWRAGKNFYNPGWWLLLSRARVVIGFRRICLSPREPSAQNIL